MNHTPLPWKIMPCPVNKGKHPYHDNRWIATDNAAVEFSEHVPNDWTLESGSLVCEMRDATGNAAFIVESCNNYERLQQENNRLREALEAIFDAANGNLNTSTATIEAIGITAKNALGESCEK